MPTPNIPLIALQPATEVSTAQFVIAAGAGATFSNANSTVGGGGICTFTTNAAHGLTMNPAANVLPNYFVSFGGSSTISTGTGVLIGNVFRILAIPSTTTFTFWSTITTATVTSTTVIPVFYPDFGLQPKNIGGEPTMTVSSVVTAYAFPALAYAGFFTTTGANCNVYYNTDSTAIALDPVTTPSTGTPATLPAKRVAIAASSQGQLEGAYPWLAVWANGTTATSYFSVTR